MLIWKGFGVIAPFIYFLSGILQAKDHAKIRVFKLKTPSK